MFDSRVLDVLGLGAGPILSHLTILAVRIPRRHRSKLFASGGFGRLPCDRSKAAEKSTVVLGGPRGMFVSASRYVSHDVVVVDEACWCW